jgi:hypothetical protein
VPERMRVQGDLFHGRIPACAVYVGHAAPGLPVGEFANPFKVREPVRQGSDLWPFTPQMVPGGAAGLASISFEFLAELGNPLWAKATRITWKEDDGSD